LPALASALCLLFCLERPPALTLSVRGLGELRAELRTTTGSSDALKLPPAASGDRACGEQSEPSEEPSFHSDGATESRPPSESRTLLNLSLSACDSITSMDWLSKVLLLPPGESAMLDAHGLRSFAPAASGVPPGECGVCRSDGDCDSIDIRSGRPPPADPAAGLAADPRWLDGEAAAWPSPSLALSGVPLRICIISAPIGLPLAAAGALAAAAVGDARGDGGGGAAGIDAGGGGGGIGDELACSAGGGGPPPSSARVCARSCSSCAVSRCTSCDSVDSCWYATVVAPSPPAEASPSSIAAVS